jgi:tetratricopeptide (TPR) repeat protein
MSTSLKCGYRVLSLAALAFALYLTFTNQSEARFFGSPSGQEQSKSAEQLMAEADRIASSGASESLNKAVDLLTQALELYRTAKNPTGKAVVLHKLAIAYDSLGNKERALEYYNESLSILRETGNRRGEALVLGNIGLLFSSLGEVDRALEYYRQALAIFRATADRGAEALILNNIGRIYDAGGAGQST